MPWSWHNMEWNKITFFFARFETLVVSWSNPVMTYSCDANNGTLFLTILSKTPSQENKDLEENLIQPEILFGQSEFTMQTFRGAQFLLIYVICFFSIISFFVVLWAFIMCIISSFGAIKFTWLDHLVLGLPGFLLPSTHPCMVTFSRQSPSLTMWPFDSGWGTRDVFWAGPPESAQYRLIVEQKNLNLCRIMKDLIIAGCTRWKPGLITMSYM